MHADKIRSANLPALRLDPRDAVVLMSIVGIVGFFLGIMVGLSY